MPLIHSRANWDQLVHAPTVQSVKGCICMTCGRIVDFEGVVEGYPGGEDGSPGHSFGHGNGSGWKHGTTWAKWLVRHHGAEELRTFDMGSDNWDYADVAQMARRTNWFDPTAHEGLGLGSKIEAADHDGQDR